MSADLGAVLSAATEYGDARAAEVAAEANARLEEVRAECAATVARIQAEFDDYRASHPDTPTTSPAPLIGMSAPANLWASRKAAVEQGGGKLQARRVFLQGLTSSLALVEAAHAEGLLPIVSFKPGPWGDVAAGKSDAALKALSQRLAALGKPVVVTLHHEPDTKSTPPDVGEGGTASEFAAMYARAIPLLKAAPNVQVWVIMNGWWWDGSRGALTDDQIAAWLPPAVRSLLDGVASDDYSPAGGGNPAVNKTRNRAEWAKRMGDVKALGIGETNAYTAAELADVFAFVKSEPLFRGGWALVWNSTGTDYQPLDATGLLDDFRVILRDWTA